MFSFVNKNIVSHVAFEKMLCAFFFLVFLLTFGDEPIIIPTDVENKLGAIQSANREMLIAGCFIQL